MSGPPPPVLPPPKITAKPPVPQGYSIFSQLTAVATTNFSAVKLKSVPKEEIRERTYKGSEDTYVQLKPTVQHKYTGPPQVVLVISTTAWLVYEWLSPEIKKVLFTTEAALTQIKESGKTEALDSFLKIETFTTLTSGLVEWKASQLHKSLHFTHVLAFLEEDLIRAARIRESLGITHGQNTESALRYRDKILMKQILRDAGVKVPEFAPVESASDIVNFCEKHGYNVVVKPRKGYSSVNTWIIHDEEKLQELLDSGFNTISGFDSALDLDIEEFVTGEMYHIDGFVYDGEVKICWPSKYTNACVDFKNSNYLASYSLKKENPLTERLREATVTSVKALGGPSCFPFHAEFFVTPSGDIVFCEIASRTGGAGVRHQLWYLFGLMADKTFAQWQAEDEITNPELGSNWEERPTLKDESVGWLFIYPRVGEIEKIPSDCPFESCIMYKPFASVGDRFENRTNCVDAVVSIVYGAKTEEGMLQAVKELYDWFTENTVYKPL